MLVRLHLAKRRALRAGKAWRPEPNSTRGDDVTGGDPMDPSPPPVEHLQNIQRERVGVWFAEFWTFIGPPVLLTTALGTVSAFIAFGPRAALWAFLLAPGATVVTMLAVSLAIFLINGSPDYPKTSAVVTRVSGFLILGFMAFLAGRGALVAWGDHPWRACALGIVAAFTAWISIRAALGRTGDDRRRG